MAGDRLAKIVCPTCQKSGTWSEDNPYRPFCSERCKLIDLGSWADESHKIKGEPVGNGNDDSDKSSLD